MQTLQDAEKSTDVDLVVASLYDGVVCPGDWYDALDAMRIALGADSFHLFTLRCNDAAVLGHVLSNVVDAPGDGPRAHAFDRDPLDLVGAMARWAPVAVPLPSQGPAAALAIALHAEDDTREVLGFVRTGAAAVPYEASTRALFERLSPHLVRASALRAHIRHLTGPAAIGLSTLDGLAQGMAVVDEDCRVQYLNRAAQACCTAHGGAGRVVQGRLMPTQSPQRIAFRRLVRLACEPSGSAAGGVLRARADAGAVVGISVWPLKAGHRHLALVVFAGLAAMAGPCALSRVLGLTPTEAGLALWLAEGKTLNDFAGNRQCSGHTARSHLKNLMQKTGCHRQMELVQLVQAMRPAWNAGPAPVSLPIP